MALTNHKLWFLFFSFVLAIALALPKTQANIADFDEYLQKKAAESYEESLNAFNPNPEELTDEFNQQVGE